MKIGVTSIYVDDQEKALRSYVDVLDAVPRRQIEHLYWRARQESDVR
jgi:catechol 2,3-dioxygenase-like lactoylglutathione lyase family enzyme